MTGEGLSPAARALLDAARDGMGPDAAAIARMKAEVVSTAGATATTAMAIKLGIVAVVATLAAGAAIYGNRSRAVTPPRIEISATHSESSAPVAQIRADSTTRGANASLRDAPIEMAPDLMTRTTLAPIAPPSAHTATATNRSNATAPSRATQNTENRSDGTTRQTAASRGRAELSREVELLDLAMSALRRGDTTSALAAIRSHASETRGSGQLAEDAAAIEIEALCRRHDPSVVAKLDAFDARFPRSAQRSRLSVTCP